MRWQRQPYWKECVLAFIEETHITESQFVEMVDKELRPINKSFKHSSYIQYLKPSADKYPSPEVIEATARIIGVPAGYFFGEGPRPDVLFIDRSTLSYTKQYVMERVVGIIAARETNDIKALNILRRIESI